MDGRTDMTKLIVTFCNFANAPKRTTRAVIMRNKYKYLMLGSSCHVQTVLNT